MANYEELVHLDIINAMELEEANLENKRKVFNRQDAFDMPEYQFVKLFRLTKNVTSNLIDTLENYIEPPSRKSALEVSVKVNITVFPCSIRNFK